MSRARAEREISGGIASVSAALHGLKPAPFFRIPGLLRASSVEAYLASRGLITWSADVPSDDWRRISDTEIVRRTIARLEAHNGGMVLLHDIRPATALALPKLLRELKARGFRIVHVVPAGGPVVTTATAPGQWAVRAASRKPSVKRATRTRLAERRVKNSPQRQTQDNIAPAQQSLAAGSGAPARVGANGRHSRGGPGTATRPVRLLKAQSGVTAA